jgi:3-methyladenine DNA glycosylase AlkD
LRVRRELKRVADPRKAPMMKEYMKSAMPYHGVNAPLLRQTCKRLFADVDLSTSELWRSQVLELWRDATHREERYAAIELTGHKRAALYQAHAAMSLYEEIIVTGAWWDYVDAVASQRVGPILRNHPVPMRKMMLAWSKSENLWKRRTSIICQLGFKKDTDLDLLYACMEPSLDSNEFFLRKAIGWALRQYGWTDPTEVRRYVRRNEARLSGLSKREALKNISF